MTILIILIVICTCYNFHSPNAFSSRPFSRISTNYKNTFSDIIRECRKVGNYSKAINKAELMLNSIETVSAIEITGIIKAYGESGRLGDALNVLKSMEKKNIKPNEYHMSALIQACRKANQWEMALGIYSRLLTYGIKDNSITGNCIISTLADARQFDLAYEIFKQLKQLKLQTAFTYSVMIVACEKQGYWQQALDIYHTMKSENFQPNTIIFNNVLQACINNGQYQQAYHIFNDSQNIIQNDAISYSLVITALGNMGMFDQAWELFHSMDGHGHGHIDNKVNSDSSSNISSNISGSDSGISNSNNNNINNSISISSSRSNIIKKDTGVYNTMLAVCAKAGQWQRALLLLDSMGHGHLATTAQTRVYSDTSTTTNQIRVYPDKKSFSIVISCLGEAFQWKDALSVYNRITTLKEGVVKDSVIYYSIITALQIAIIKIKCEQENINNSSSNNSDAQQQQLQQGNTTTTNTNTNNNMNSSSQSDNQLLLQSQSQIVALNECIRVIMSEAIRENKLYQSDRNNPYTVASSNNNNNNDNYNTAAATAATAATYNYNSSKNNSNNDNTNTSNINSSNSDSIATLLSTAAIEAVVGSGTCSTDTSAVQSSFLTPTNLPYATAGINGSTISNTIIIDLHGLSVYVAQARIDTVLTQLVRTCTDEWLRVSDSGTATTATGVTASSGSSGSSLTATDSTTTTTTTTTTTSNSDNSSTSIITSINSPSTTQLKNIKNILIITGKGNHINTQGTRKILRTEIEKYLKTQYPTLQLSFPADNDGCILITITDK